MKDWIPLLQSLVWPLFTAVVLLWGRRTVRAVLDAAADRIRAGAPLKLGPSGLELGQAVAPPDAPRPVVDLQPSQIRATAYNLAVINRSSILKDDEVQNVVNALQKQVHQHLAPVWGVDAEIHLVPPQSAPEPGHWWLEVLDKSDAPGALGYHGVTPDGLPSAKVFFKSSQDAGYLWSAVASHELLKMLVNPRANLSVLREGPEGLLYALEICDACAGDLYSVDGVQVTNFVFPAWFIASQPKGSTQFDYLRHITAPFELMPNGYATYAGPDLKAGWRHTFNTGQHSTNVIRSRDSPTPAKRRVPTSRSRRSRNTPGSKPGG